MSHESDEVTSEEQNTNGNNGNRVTSPSSKAISESMNLNGTNSGRHSILWCYKKVASIYQRMEKIGLMRQSQKINKKTFSLHGCTRSLKQQHDCIN
jgi:hypothetical protein